MKDKKLKNWILFIAGLLVCSFGDSMIFKGGVGASPYEATQMTASYITGMKVGTLAIISNILLILGQFLIYRKMSLSLLIQLPLCIIQGNLLNLILYVFFGKLEFNYIASLLFFIAGICVSAFGVGLMVNGDITVFPLEGFCQAVSDKTGFDFAKCRMAADIICVVLCLAVSLIFGYPFAVREGTVIAALLFSLVIKLSMDFIKKTINKKS